MLRRQLRMLGLVSRQWRVWNSCEPLTPPPHRPRVGLRDLKLDGQGGLLARLGGDSDTLRFMWVNGVVLECESRWGSLVPIPSFGAFLSLSTIGAGACTGAVFGGAADACPLVCVASSLHCITVFDPSLGLGVDSRLVLETLPGDSSADEEPAVGGWSVVAPAMVEAIVLSIALRFPGDSDSKGD